MHTGLYNMNVQNKVKKTNKTKAKTNLIRCLNRMIDFIDI